mmetsp:Transcript_80626/g.233125  ORF Transcript_80626/g.233125 Transcript_80626/m.233125 type:complete len:300 (+) Transcript_80626:518-1417(+)
MGPCRHVEGSCQDLRGILRPGDEGNPLAMRLLISADALARRHTPDLELAVLTAGGKELRVLRKGRADHRLLVHHEAPFLLVRQILPEHGSLVVPDFDETVHGTGDAELTVRRETRALGMRLLAELDGLRDHRRALFPLLDRVRRDAAEDVDAAVRGQDSSMLLPLERLADQRQQARWRRHTNVLAHRLRDLAAFFLLRLAIEGLARVEVGLFQECLQAEIPLGDLLFHCGHGRCLSQEVQCGLDLSRLGELKDDLHVQVLHDVFRETQVGHRLQYDVPPAVVDIAQETVEGVHGVQRHT